MHAMPTISFCNCNLYPIEVLRLSLIVKLELYQQCVFFQESRNNFGALLFDCMMNTFSSMTYPFKKTHTLGIGICCYMRFSKIRKGLLQISFAGRNYMIELHQDDCNVDCSLIWLVRFHSLRCNFGGQKLIDFLRQHAVAATAILDPYKHGYTLKMLVPFAFAVLYIGDF
ncbi:unnamed protein product [Albugo candida]|uniref:Uncharacterized protein n=1 Tax=Albugo candida TaxID=65357 RepID=A0A024G3U0_9STRA|nr:unnamed protein product [Albugo candida]|eukprot:CCI40969.1 unnamed protein product [Albugo candida]